MRKSPRQSDAEKAPEIEITEEMVVAGLRVAWSAPNPPQFVVQQVKRIYEAMERAKRAKSQPSARSQSS